MSASDDERLVLAAARSHLDGDPRPRPAELIECNQLRVAQGLDVFVLIIMTGTDLDQSHAWAIFERDGKIGYEAAELQIVPD